MNSPKVPKSFPLIWVTRIGLLIESLFPKTRFFHQWLRFLDTQKDSTKVTLSARQTPFFWAAPKTFFSAKVAALYHAGLYYETFPVYLAILPNFHPSLPTFTTLGLTLFTKLKFWECFWWENMKRHQSLEKRILKKKTCSTTWFCGGLTQAKNWMFFVLFFG